MNLLFMCVANSARSQLAEGIARSLLPQHQIESAGSNPGRLNPYAIRVMQEIGIDISQQYSKSIDDLNEKFVQNLDFVITLCAEEVCPVILSQAKKLHWPFPDPATQEPVSDEESLKRFRDVRDGILKRIEQLKRELK